MAPIKTISIIMVLLGAVTLIMSFPPAIRICRSLIGRVRGKWLIILYLMGIFLVGYICFDIVLIANIQFPVELITGGVFLGGALFVYIIINVTQSTIANLKKAEGKIINAKEEWKNTFDAVTDIITIHDNDFNIVSANRAAKEFLALQPHEGKYPNKCFKYYHGTDNHPYSCKSCQSIQAGKSSVFEVFESHLNKHLEIRVMPRFGKDGNLVGNIHIVRDISARNIADDNRKKLEKQLQQAHKMESIGTLAGGIAHDFNNILSAIIGFTELALYEVEKESTIESKMQEVYGAGIRAKELVGQILTYARQTDEKTQPIQIDTIVKEVLRFIRSSIPTTIEIKSYIKNDLIIMGSETQAHQIMMNLCTNAAHAMEAGGGVLEVSLNAIEIDKILGNDLGLTSGNYVELSVSDTGTGIPPDIIDSIFDPYYTTKKRGEGTGMGLAMVHGIVKSHGGKITVNSNSNEGSTFTIYLPAVLRSDLKHQYELDQLPKGTEHILIVDDEPTIAQLERLRLERLGYQVTIRTSSIEARELFRAKPDDFDLVISDVTMPHLTGNALGAEIMAARPDIPVILCTGYSKLFSKDMADETGIKAVLHKPIVEADLAKTVRKVLDEAMSKSTVI